MQHFSHPHQLYDASNIVSHTQNYNLACFGCKLPLSGTCYACLSCNFYLHKFCFDLPQSAYFFGSHQQHTLVLLYPPYSRGGPCDACGELCNGFTYNCAPCNYSVHANCATLLHPDPRNDRDLYVSTFVRHKVSEIKTLKSQLGSSVKQNNEGECIHPYSASVSEYKLMKVAPDASVTLMEQNNEDEKVYISRMEREEKLQQMREDMEMQQLMNTYASMARFNTI